MAQVTVTYNAWDHNRAPIPAAQQPRVGFRPIRTSLTSGMMTDREVWGTLAANGAGSVKLESGPGLLYVPFVDWLLDPNGDEPQNRARGISEWDPIYPATGGPIDALPGVVRFNGFFYGFGDPPSHLRSRDDVIYIDISGSSDGYWQPWVPAGTAVEGDA